MLNRLRKLIPRTWRGRLRVIVYGLPVILLAADLAWVRYLRHIPIARDTTYLTAPLGENGWPDYLGWMNDELKKGVTPEKNAAIPLAKIAGTFAQNDTARKAWLAEVGG